MKFENKKKDEKRKSNRSKVETINKKNKIETTNKNSKVEAINNENVEREDLVEGRNAVIEALKSDKRTVEQVLIATGDTKGSISVVIGLAKEKKIVIKEVDRRKLDAMSQTGNHQGVIAIVTPYKYFEVEDILSYAKEKGENPFILILDEIEDPHNFGALIRTAEVSGVHGIIIPKRRNVGITPTVYKSSAGAVEYMKIAKVTNINATIDELKNKGIWIYGADMSGENYTYNTDFSGAVGIVVGSEGNGISKLTKSKCDVLVKIPMIGKVTSLNASVAGGIFMYEVLRNRQMKR